MTNLKALLEQTRMTSALYERLREIFQETVMDESKVSSKPFHEMTLPELRAELEVWDRKIAEAPRWGAALTAAYEFREQCLSWIARREREEQKP